MWQRRPFQAAGLALLLAAPVFGQASLDTAAIHRVTGVAGTASGREYKVSVAQNDLDVRVDGFPINPPMGTGSWAAFTLTADGTMLMGDVVLLPAEIGPVQRTALEHGLHVTGLHNHFVRDEPHVMFMHIHGAGRTEDRARGVRAVLDRVAALRGHSPPAAPAASAPGARWTRCGSRPSWASTATWAAASTG